VSTSLPDSLNVKLVEVWMMVCLLLPLVEVTLQTYLHVRLKLPFLYVRNVHLNMCGDLNDLLLLTLVEVTLLAYLHLPFLCGKSWALDEGLPSPALSGGCSSALLYLHVRENFPFCVGKFHVWMMFCLLLPLEVYTSNLHACLLLPLVKVTIQPYLHVRRNNP
jgi:hypothetical protein